ncbi:unnamed protein product [uncultured bacterium]|nr:unnamed protein product [uncultured bacterium]
MLINGFWLLCQDDIVRPVLLGEVLKADGSWMPAHFLIDSGADQTVFSVDVLNALQLPPAPATTRLEGIGEFLLRWCWKPNSD